MNAEMVMIVALSMIGLSLSITTLTKFALRKPKRPAAPIIAEDIDIWI